MKPGRATTEFLSLRLSTAIATLLLNSGVLANPVLDHVAAGQVSVSPQSSNMTVTQTSDKAIINWQSFNIGANESTHFAQPVNGIALNRISPQMGASQIYGHLSATGRIILVNQAGIYFGPTAHVDVAGLIASTRDISDANFLAGKYTFDQGSSYNGSIINQGQIIAANHGLVALVGQNVRNDGTIQAHLGSIALASGNKFTVDLYGDQMVNFTVEGAAPAADVDHAVTNNGSLIADGGTIIMTARTARGIVDNVVNMNGIARAQSVSEKDGVIILDAGAGTASVAGKIDVAGKEKNTQGGTVKILARNIHLEKPAAIDASGDAGGGEILIGGNYQGRGPELNAYYTRIDNGVTINADAIDSGNGGKVIVWADGVTDFAGSISARGGINGGNGGMAEVSGHQLLEFHGAVDLRAPLGARGNLLLDPENLIIQNTGPTTATFNSPDTYTAGVDDSILTVADLDTLLSSTNVTVQTLSTPGAQAGNITVADPISWSTTNSLTLSAYGNIILNSSITSSAAANVILRADNTGTGNGTISGAGVITTAAGGTATFYYNPVNYASPTNFSANVSGATLTAYMLVNDVTELQNMNTNFNGNYALGKNIDASITSTWNSGAGYLPVGTNASPFTGQFDGQNYVIDSLYINRPTLSYNGLFGYAEIGASKYIKNVGLTNIFINAGGIATRSLGGISGYFGAGTIENTYVRGGSITETNASPCGTWCSAGGVVGSVDNGGIIRDSYNTAFITGYSETGGLVGDIWVGNVYNSYNTGRVTAASGGAGGITRVLNSGTINDSYNTGAVLGGTQTGGLVWIIRTGSVINDSWNAGYVVNSNHNAGAVGLVQGGGTTNHVYWDTQTSNQTSSQLTATGQTTAQLKAALPSGFSSSTWGIDPGTSYPYLLTFNSGTPRVVSGFVPGGSINATGLGNNVVNLAANGTALWTVTTGNNGSYYFLEPNGVIADNAALITYLTGSSSNIVTTAPSSGGSLTGLNFTANTVTVGDSRTQTLSDTNALLSTAKGSLSSDILYSTSGTTDLTLNSGINFTTTAATTYTLDGNITASGSGNITFAGPVSFNTAAATLTVGSGNIVFNSDISGPSNTLLLTGAGNNTFTLTNTLNLDTLGVTGGSGTNTLNVLTNSASQDWEILGPNAGTISGAGVTNTFSFSNIQNLTGGSANDNFILNGGSISGSIDGGSGNNTLTGNNVTNAWHITGTDAGTLTDIAGSFSNIQNLIGGSGTDTFVLDDGVSINSIDGGAGANTLDLSNYSTAVNVNLATALVTGIVNSFNNITDFIGGSATNTLTGSSGAHSWNIAANNGGDIDGAINFTNFANLFGASGDDNFQFSGGSISGSIDGGGGSNTITVQSGNTNWIIDGSNTGSITTSLGGFSNIQNLTGGTGISTFNFIGNGGLSGTIDGGNVIDGGPSGTNTIDFTNYTGSLPLSITLSMPLSGTDFDSGSISDSTSALIVAFTRIKQAIGSTGGNDILILPNNKTTVVINYTTPTSGTINDPFYFNNLSVQYNPPPPPAAQPAPPTPVDVAKIITPFNTDNSSGGTDDSSGSSVTVGTDDPNVTWKNVVETSITKILEHEQVQDVKQTQQRSFGCFSE